jgi:hypothetical protein
MIKVPNALLAENINAYSVEGQLKKTQFHTAGKKFLKSLALELGLEDFVVRSNLGGMAVSGEITLHSDDFYAQFSESATSRGVSLMYRSCASKKDFCGNRNNFVNIRELLTEDHQRGAFAGMRRVLSEEMSNKQSRATA